jgi:hypothetical protein
MQKKNKNWFIIRFQYSNFTLDLSNSLSHGGCVKTISEKLEKKFKKKNTENQKFIS